MRRFYFENENGDRVPLNDETGIFLYRPDGLGVEFEHEYGDYAGSGFFRRNKFKVSQMETSFVLLFDPNKVFPYKRYRELLDWFAAVKELYLVYAPIEAAEVYQKTEEYYKQINVRSIEKSEIDQLGALSVQVTVLPLTPWFLSIPFTTGVNNDYDDAMRYDFTFDNNLIYGVDSNRYEVAIPTGGHMPASILLTFKGTIVNPTVTLHGMHSGKIYGECEVTESFRADDTFVLSTQEQNSYVKKISNGEEIDLIDKLDITKNAFFTVPLDEPCKVLISGTNINGEATVKVYQYYRGV